MPKTYQPCLITITAPDQETAERLGHLLLTQKLAACVQFDDIASHYLWQGELCRDNEVRLTIKTARRHYRRIEALILHEHPYECPQILMQRIDGGYTGYLKWAKAVLGL